MNQNIWGPQMWFVLHTITFNYPIKPTETDKTNMNNFFLSLKPILPCMYCRKNYERHLKEKPIRLNSRKDLVYWLIDIHNEVNGQEGKKQYSYDEVLKIYSDKLNKKIDLDKTDSDVCDIHANIYCLLMHYRDYIYIIIILFLLFLVYKYYR